MISLNDLRIDNWVQIDDLPPERITLDTFCTLKQFPATISKFNPIQITTEVLALTDFKSDNIKTISYSKGKIQVWYAASTKKYMLWLIDKDIFFEKEVSYLHQLQNLYFFLTDQELTVNL